MIITTVASLCFRSLCIVNLLIRDVFITAICKHSGLGSARFMLVFRWAAWWIKVDHKLPDSLSIKRCTLCPLPHEYELWLLWSVEYRGELMTISCPWTKIFHFSIPFVFYLWNFSHSTVRNPNHTEKAHIGSSGMD